ncbi:formylmethanofuran dehydrogenase subunit D [Methanohalophilus levihalophilus]|uniref:molybdopterin dinucleotide binding domain-containing protein n=1 Tax=Methanohalophilus levihalophilus TaxID=1431282 RepID=UPI001AE370E9|nr:molybdopterin dinucleotide binding domain-containing protein [Methanohalophilus levihalophilus]MBP2029623.1 formylmethanofuran dehydrogenase subunit D [Methanohalophilus levihalophilus]
MGFGQFISKPEVDILIVTHRNIFQNSALESSRFSVEYAEQSAVIMLTASDMKKLQVENNGSVLLQNKWGKVVVRARQSEEEKEHNGVGYMVNSPWSNMLVSPETNGTGVPDFKKIKVTASSTEDEDVTVIPAAK